VPCSTRNVLCICPLLSLSIPNLPLGSVQKTVLLVDDDDDSRRIFRLALEHAGHTVLIAHDGLEGIRLACLHQPDAILMDIAMPVMDGYTALKQLRSNVATRDLPILALTARGSLDEAAELLEAGFDELLIKPIAPVEVVTAIARSGTAA
jgi:two-component system, sensor histidine kinase